MTESSPRAEYRRRLGERQAEAARLDRRDRRLGDARLVVFGLALLAVWPT